MKRWTGLALLAVAAAAPAHPLAPGLLEMQALPSGEYAVTWRTSVARAASGLVEPRLPERCTPASPVETRLEDGAQVARWRVACKGSLAGQVLTVDRIEGSGINVIVRVGGSDGREFKALLGADEPATTVRFDDGGVFARYLALGAQHLLTGADHLLFLLGLFLLVTGVRALVATVTAFTVGHSLTLALAALGYVPLPQAWAEILAALTVLALALELARGPNAAGLMGRQPWLVAGGFGLVHGLGFAGALRDIGLPAADIPLSLLAFNLGIEAGQLGVMGLFVAGSMLKARLGSRPHAPGPSDPVFATYLIGSMAACWVLERSAGLLNA